MKISFLDDNEGSVRVIRSCSVIVWNVSDLVEPRNVFEMKREGSLYRPIAAFSADSTRFGTCLSRGSIDVWNIADGKHIRQVESRENEDIKLSELRPFAFPSDPIAGECNTYDSEPNCQQFRVIDGEFYLQSPGTDLKALSPPEKCLDSQDWAFDRSRGCLWLRTFEERLFIAQLELPLERVE